jgi:hypothetical protein
MKVPAVFYIMRAGAASAMRDQPSGCVCSLIRCLYWVAGNRLPLTKPKWGYNCSTE